MFVVISAGLLLLYALLIIFYRQQWIKTPVSKLTPGEYGQNISISVIIPARNEGNNLPALLQSLQAQTYAKHLFETIVINDYSTDDTAAVVKQFPDVILINLADELGNIRINAYKKKAIEIAIARSTGNIIVTTDADGVVPPKWLSNIAASFDQQPIQLLVMPVAMFDPTASDGPFIKFLKIFQALDFMTLQGITGASVHAGFHSMCNGANLAYTKYAFNTVGGFKDIDQLASGDDMLLMHKINKQFAGQIKYLKAKEVIVHTAAMSTIKDFLNQRIRWASKADTYKDHRIVLVLALVYLVNLGLLLFPILSFFYQSPIFIHLRLIHIWCIFLFFKIGVEFYFLWPVAEFFNKKQLLWYFPLAQLFHIVYTVVAGFLGKFGTYKWKGRLVK